MFWNIFTMHPQSQMALEIRMPSTESALLNDVDYNFGPSTSVTSGTQKSGQKRTRQWAAWTRQEQENFFSALRQVGKNFEKITCRVQSKNKNQVRHYYYRLVRRMNKLLSPGFCLDAKNSKDTNAAMLRWWSLLEKYSCTPSKLHRKPRRFKIFIEALESQLLKDRNKARRKRPCQGENCLETSATWRFSEHDFVGVKAVVADAENTPKIGINRGPSMKRNTNSNVSFSKGVFPATKATGQRHRTGLVESAAYKRWEKAAMAGVSLVADAAEQLERVTNCENSTSTQDMHNFSGVGSHRIGETVVQTREKLKLQLFPVDEDTRQRIEKGANNPFLELTLSARKRISSVLEHLNRKWGTDTIGSAELLLLPYNIQQGDIARCQRWTIKDADSTAADVHAAVGNPSVFRLRYCWFSGHEPGARLSNSTSAPDSDDYFHSEDIIKRFIPPGASETTHFCCTSKLVGESCNGSPLPSATSITEMRAQSDTLKLKDGLPESSGKSPSLNAYRAKEGSGNQAEDMSDPAVRCSSDLLAGEWADSLTNISIGDLLLETSEASSQQNSLCLQQTSFSCDSFDAAVAAHSYFPQFSGLGTQAPVVSIWNAEETCDEFSFKTSPTLGEKGFNLSTNVSPRVSRDPVDMNSPGLVDRYVEDFKKSRHSNDNPSDEPESDNPSAFSCKQEPVKDVSLTDLYWPDSLGSLGQLDLDLPFSRYPSQDICFSERSISQSSFNGMMAGCLDLFQSGSRLGTEKKEIVGTVEEASGFDDEKMALEDC
ncbi:TSL-kinase interacting protein 1 [Phalaenopsis equestris]|uniref:TSL-kinase interacting protein 1 n=1 Tax=Phalaenopsis equestris TaxID=78828 RepID=UPI0009E435E6|nr:TSL-kinase interacting protein 1 [Phalaenopsis equestris]